jgi:hypothetical protein
MEGERPDVHSSVIQPMLSREPEGSPAGAPESSEDSDMPEDTGGVFSTPKKTAHVKTSPNEPSGVWSFTPHLFRWWFDPEKPADDEVSAYTSELDKSPSPRGPRPLRKNERNQLARQRRRARHVVPQPEGGEPSSELQVGTGGSGWQIPPVQLNQGSLFKEIDKTLSEDDEYRDKNHEYQVTRDWGLQKREEPQSVEAPKADELPGDPLVVYEAQGTREPEGTAPIAKVPLPRAQESRRTSEGNRAGSPTIPALIFDPPLTEEEWLSNIARADELAAKIRAQRPVRRGKGGNTAKSPDVAIPVVPDNTYKPQLAFSTAGTVPQQDLHVRSVTVTIPAGESRMEGEVRRFTVEEKGKG